MSTFQFARSTSLGCYAGARSGQAQLDPWSRLGRTWLCVAALAFGGLGCRSGFSHASRIEVPDEARASLIRGFALEGEGKPADAILAWRRAIEIEPEYVDAHRAYQNLLLARGRRGQLIDEYRAWAEQAPQSAVRVYLLSRLWSDRSRQRAGFERAALLDPDSFFAHIGVGHSSLADGDLERAEHAFERAHDLEPSRTEPLVGWIETLARRRDDVSRARVEELARDLLERDPSSAIAMRRLTEAKLRQGDIGTACSALTQFVCNVDTPEAWDLAYAVLSDQARASDVEAARDRIADVVAAPWLGPPELAYARLRTLADVEMRCGNPARALRWIERAPPQYASDATLLALRRRAWIATGRLDLALEDAVRARYASGFLLHDDTGSADRVREALSSWKEGAEFRAHDALGVVERLRGAGLVDAALEAAEIAIDRDPTAHELVHARDELLAHRRFVAELREYFVRGYREPALARAALDEVLEDIREIARASLGENVVDPVRINAYYPIGAFLDPDPSHGGGLARYFDRFGTFFLIGQRAFGPPEGYAVRRVAAGRIDVDGRSTYRILGEELVVPPRAEWGGAQIAGFAFDTFIVLNVDRARAFADRARRLFATFGPEGGELLGDPVPVARGGLERVDPSEPLGLASKAMFRSVRAHLDRGGTLDDYAGVALDAFESHERAHIEDARRFLPLGSDLIEKIRVLGRLGFAPSRVEAWLEERAQARALLDAASPWAVLAGTADLLPNRNDSPPHSIGFFDLSKRWIEGVEQAREEYPALDPERPVLPQLDRLSEDDLRRLARSVIVRDETLPALVD
jgi:tetratricopeptide (TPR) repeat protein